MKSWYSLCNITTKVSSLCNRTCFQYNGHYWDLHRNLLSFEKEVVEWIEVNVARCRSRWEERGPLPSMECYVSHYTYLFILDFLSFIYAGFRCRLLRSEPESHNQKTTPWGRVGPNALNEIWIVLEFDSLPYLAGSETLCPSLFNSLLFFLISFRCFKEFLNGILEWTLFSYAALLLADMNRCYL